VSCSVHDVVRLERRGVPSVAVATRPFVDEAVEQAQVLGMPRIAVVYVPHPVQLLDPSALRGLADGAFPAVIDGLTTD
jgi:hypothetical protein